MFVHELVLVYRYAHMNVFLLVLISTLAEKVCLAITSNIDLDSPTASSMNIHNIHNVSVNTIRMNGSTWARMTYKIGKNSCPCKYAYICILTFKPM